MEIFAWKIKNQFQWRQMLQIVTVVNLCLESVRNHFLGSWHFYFEDCHMYREYIPEPKSIGYWNKNIVKDDFGSPGKCLYSAGKGIFYGDWTYISNKY